MPRRELKHPYQIAGWLREWGQRLSSPGSLILIGSGALLWHAHQQGITTPLPENSMDVDPVTTDDHVAELAYQALIGSEFELQHGWHVNLMPTAVLRELPEGWAERSSIARYELLTVRVPSPADLLVPKLKRGEPRDLKHAAWAQEIGLVQSVAKA